MATNTTNYGWTKPSYEDAADIEVINSTFDSIDEQVKANDDKSNSALVELVDSGAKNLLKIQHPMAITSEQILPFPIILMIVTL